MSNQPGSERPDLDQPARPPATEQPVTDLPATDPLDGEINDAFEELIGAFVGHVEDLARRLSLPAFCVKALHMLSSPMAMKQLGQRFHCDPSFVTSIADMLDSRGLGKRETDTRDRRIKNLLLTPKGLALRERVERELATCMPWAQALDTGERKQLLALLRKMIKAEHERRAGTAAPATPGRRAATDSRASQADNAGGPPDATGTPQVVTGGYRAGEVTREPSPVTSSGS